MPIPLLVAASVAVATLAVSLPPMTIPDDSAAVTVEAKLTAISRRQLLAAPKVVLDLDAIEAARPPNVYFEVYVHAKGAPRGRTVGNLALFGTGIRSEARGEFRPAHVRLVITSAMRAALRKSSTVAITFVAQGAGGAVAAARSRSAVTIAKPSIRRTP